MCNVLAEPGACHLVPPIVENDNFLVISGQSDVVFGRDDGVKDMGIIPCAISWLYQLIDDRKQR